MQKSQDRVMIPIFDGSNADLDPLSHSIQRFLQHVSELLCHILHLHTHLPCYSRQDRASTWRAVEKNDRLEIVHPEAAATAAYFFPSIGVLQEDSLDPNLTKLHCSTKSE